MATGSSNTTSSTVFHGDDYEQASDYRSLSVLAILSLVAGCIAPVAYIAPFLLVFPLVGIALALLALRQIAVSDGLLAGRWAAIIGLVLSIASVVLPFSHYLALRTMRMNEAQAFGRRWVELVTAGKMEEAFQLTIDSTRPNAPPEPGAPPTPAPYQLFIDLPIIKELKSAGAGANIEVRETLEYKPENYRVMTIRQLYRVTAAAGAPSQPIDVVLTIVRGVLPRDNMSRWMISRYEPKTADDSSTAK